MNLEIVLRREVEKATGKAVECAQVTKLKGDASNRSYYRVGQSPESWVVMVMPAGTASASEEATKGGRPSELPFINIQRYLAGLSIRVPEIVSYNEAAGLMVLEDLSDVTFEQALGNGEHRQELYGQAVDLLARLRAAAERNPDSRCIAFTRFFDEDLYDWELHHFREWGLEIWSREKPTSSERLELDRIFRSISARLASVPRGFTHRDYQSRNLMVKNGELVVIDFQDALQGPRQYDLVALLRDSYVELDDAFVDQMLNRYVASFEKASGEKIHIPAFKSIFDLLTVQRKLKDAGRFEYINRVKGNPGFLCSIPQSLRYVRAALARQNDLADLRTILGTYVPELA